MSNDSFISIVCLDDELAAEVSGAIQVGGRTLEGTI